MSRRTRGRVMDGPAQKLGHHPVRIGVFGKEVTVTTVGEEHRPQER